MKVYIVRSEAYDPIDERPLGSAVEGVFDSEEKAIEDIKKHYGDNHCKCYEGRGYRSYAYETDGYNVYIDVVEWNVNESVWGGLA